MAPEGDRFDSFRQAVRNSFGFLRELGFKAVGESSSYRDIEMAFRRRSSRFVVGYESVRDRGRTLSFPKPLDSSAVRASAFTSLFKTLTRISPR
jgi:hypothetical protein